MPLSTPPAATHDHKPAHDWADGMEGRADGWQEGGHGPFWYRWALVEAYMAGRAAAKADAEPTAAEGE